MKKKVITFLFAVLTASAICGCGDKEIETGTDPVAAVQNEDTVKEEHADDMPQREQGGNTAKEENTDNVLRGKQTENTETEENTDDVPEAENEEAVQEFSFADLKDVEFQFASGAGGWGTVLTIAADGTFSGVYHDSELGDAGEGYPDGTMYYSSFQGKFAEPVQADSYTYITSIEEISYTNPHDGEEIINDIRYVYMDVAYGLEDAGDIIIYLPGMPTADLPKGYFEWVKIALYTDYDWEEIVPELPFYGLYNLNAEEGFSSDTITDPIEEWMAYTEERADRIEYSFGNDPLSQSELTQKSIELYEVWDAALNTIWAELKQTLPEAEMNELTVRQREWIAMKEQQAEEAGKEAEGGTMEPMLFHLKAAELTKARVYELLELL